MAVADLIVASIMSIFGFQVFESPSRGFPSGPNWCDLLPSRKIKSPQLRPVFTCWDFLRLQPLCRFTYLAEDTLTALSPWALDCLQCGVAVASNPCSGWTSRYVMLRLAVALGRSRFLSIRFCTTAVSSSRYVGQGFSTLVPLTCPSSRLT